MTPPADLPSPEWEQAQIDREVALSRQRLLWLQECERRERAEIEQWYARQMRDEAVCTPVDDADSFPEERLPKAPRPKL